MKIPATALLLALLGAPLTAPIPAGAGPNCADQVAATCSKCHLPARICEKLGQKNQREWRSTIKRMLRYGLVLDSAGQESMLKCLLSLAKESGNLCK